MQNTYYKQSIEFASYVQDQLRDRAKRKDRGVVQQGLLVLAQTAMPGVLIETGFITNPTEEKFLMSDYGEDLIASAIYRAFKQYKTRIEERSHFTIAPETQATVEAKDTVKEDTIKDRITFRVQIASSKNLVETTPENFQGITDVSVIQQSKWYKYTAGRNMTYEEALERCSTVKTTYPGAFVVAVKNGEIIPLKEALIEINQ